MKSVTPYIWFGDRTEDALKFYAEALGGQVTTLLHRGDVMKDTPAEKRREVFHSELVAGNVRLMASGCTPDEPQPPAKSNIELVLDCDSVEEQDHVWARLLEGGGTVRYALHDTFYGGRMGMLIDRFGTEWMVHYTREQK